MRAGSFTALKRALAALAGFLGIVSTFLINLFTLDLGEDEDKDAGTSGKHDRSDDHDDTDDALLLGDDWVNVDADADTVEVRVGRASKACCAHCRHPRANRCSSAASFSSQPLQGKLIDCPLTHTELAILRSIPHSLVLAVPRDDARRIWATALTAALMRKLEVSWALNAPGYFGGYAGVGDCKTPETLLDRTESWLERQLSPELLPRIRAAADRTLSSWAKVHDQRTSAMRAAELRTAAHRITLLQRTIGNIVRALLTTHESMSIFTSPALQGIKRWQAIMAMFSGVIACLTVNIWLFYSRSLQCCAEARMFLGCSAISTEPCHGFTGACAEDLLITFVDVYFDGAPGVPEGYTCLAFPAPDSFRDDTLLAVISFAVSLPITICIFSCFTCANAPDYSGAWLRWDLVRRVLFGKHDWRYQVRVWPRRMLFVARHFSFPACIFCIRRAPSHAARSSAC
jgi:hypothetical protein